MWLTPLWLIIDSLMILVIRIIVPLLVRIILLRVTDGLLFYFWEIHLVLGLAMMCGPWGTWLLLLLISMLMSHSDRDLLGHRAFLPLVCDG